MIQERGIPEKPTSLGFYSHWGIPSYGWFVFMENPIYKWMMTGGTPTPHFRKPLNEHPPQPASWWFEGRCTEDGSANAIPKVFFFRLAHASICFYRHAKKSLASTNWLKKNRPVPYFPLKGQIIGCYYIWFPKCQMIDIIPSIGTNWFLVGGLEHFLFSHILGC